MTHSSNKKRWRPSLLLCIFIAIGCGIGCGMFFPMWLSRCFATFNAIFSQFLGFCIPLIILGFVAPAIADIGGRAGKMLLFTAALAYVATMFAGFLSYFTGVTFFPSMIQPAEYIAGVESGADAAPAPFFNIEMPPLMAVTSALVIAFVLGLGVAKLTAKDNALHEVLRGFRDVMVKVISGVIIPLLPLYIFGIFLSMTVSGCVGMILSTFIRIIAVIFALHLFLLVFQYSVAALFSRHGKNPLKLLWTMMPAYFTALGTQSSAATIPVTLKQTIKMGVSEPVAGFTVPLCATIHMSGSVLKLVACSLALMMINGIAYDTGTFAYFIAMLAITIIAAPGVPGGAVMASLGLLSSILGFSEADNALMIALYIAMDSFGTACNVTGDGALSLIVDRFFANKTTTT
ncbi:MAG: dicarboxylate/amino acid:cation symporter [Muribaculaceae bacterium]|nr:dicarboxylate/amino acid:cation symporter [Muribaculaceae bacterium]